MDEMLKDKQVFYRKYRPQTLAEVVGQEHITTTLLNALANDHTSHAYLFCGPRGTGKTSTGRILAKAVNCLTNQGKGEPCNQCDMCRSITNGSALDVIEIDAASHTGVDDIREIIEKINYSPAVAKYKVYIIDEVHMLSTAASNALLKTLEEPPPNVKFVLATTEIHKLLPTIISRCQRFDFKRINNDAIVKQLHYICDNESATAEDAALRAIANYSRGGLRDSENLLQQVISFYGNDVTLENVRELLGTSDGKYGTNIVKNLIAQNAKECLELIGEAQRDGSNLRQLNKDIVETLRAIMLIKTGCANSLDYGADDIEELTQMGRDLSLAKIVAYLKVFGKLDSQLTDDNTLPLEVSVIEAIAGSTESEPVPVIKPAAEAKTVKSAATKAATAKTTAKEEKKAEPLVEVPKAEATKPTSVQEEPAHVKKVEPVKEAVNSSGDKISLENIKANWASLFTNLPENIRRNQGITLLKSGGITPIALSNDTLTLSFKYPIHKDMFENKDNIRVAEELFSRYLNNDCKIKCILQAEEDYLVKEAKKMGGQVIRQEEI
ncbi:MAG: DNA polymerase III subunit gamma/tau [Dehalococcoidales bacterium]|nr:DNA polymerase III subunit gamma/tau [Dehalococcoidales bacterium]